MLALVKGSRVAGKHVHEAGIVATAEAHGVRRLVTDNPRHFAGLGELEVLDLGDPSLF